MTIKACGDCRYVEKKPFRAVCRHPQGALEITDYLTGTIGTHVLSIDLMRGGIEGIGKCGPDATLFEPKEPS
jgi:hypothetical protein